MREQIRNATISTATIVEPTGGPNKIAIKSPNVAHTTDNTTEQMVTDKKLLKIRIADNAGKITNAEINKEPTRFIANTMIIAIKIAIIKL